MASLPSYVAAAQPVPKNKRAPWYKTTAQTYAGIMLWFVFWVSVPIGAAYAPGSPYSKFAGGTLSQGLGVAFVGLVIAALICHFLFYVVPGMLGMKTGLPLYIVGTSTYGVTGGFLMPGFLMGVLQFGWLGVNAFFSAKLLTEPLGYPPGSVVHSAVGIVWAVAAAFMGLKGIQYVAKVATFLPLIPLVVLVVLFFSSFGGVGKFDSKKLADTTQVSVTSVQDGTEKVETLKFEPPLSALAVIGLACTCIVGFFATAGAAGTDFGMNNRDAKDVQLGGLVGIAGATIFAGGMALLIVAGAHGLGKAPDGANLGATAMMASIMGSKTVGAVMMYLLAIAAFPPACFSSFIAANSFKTTLPKVNPFISCGIGTLASIALVVSQAAGNASDVFTVIGASFGPVCGAMAADYLLAGRKWAGPRGGFNPAGWISWIVGFAVGAYNLVAGKVPALANLHIEVPVAPVSAFIVGFVLYIILAKLGLESAKIEHPAVKMQ